MNQLNIVAIDLAKHVFQVCTVSPHNKVLGNKQLSRSKLAASLANISPAIVAMEACYSSHYWARTFQAMGHEVKLIPAQHVKPFVRGNKNDRNDALAIAEAFKRPDLRFVPIKTVEQQDIQSLHRIRDRLSQQRVALMNQTRGLLSEYGLIAAPGFKAFRELVTSAIDPANQGLSPVIKQEMNQVLEDFHHYTAQIKKTNRQLIQLANQHELCRILLSLPGIGVINATGLYSAIGDGSQFAHPRDLAVWLGLTPRQFSSGGKSFNGAITKRGNRYLRKQLIHGARAVVHRCARKDDKLSLWVNQLVARRGANKAAVALASRLARLAWILLQRRQCYEPQFSG
ncbi:MAG: IS110 family transposase [Rhodospirillaceae bacterium]|nr:IS110 family transposase [Rhodospirillaceae bacterium]